MEPCAPNEVSTDLGCFPDDPIGFVSRFYGVGLSLIGMVALLFLIFGGYTVLTSQGDPNKLQRGKEYIYYSLVGVLLAIFGFVFIEFLGGRVIRIPGFG